MAQVSCELVAPKESRPNEGILFFNIELSPLASPAFEAGRWVRDHYYTCGAALVSVTRTESSPVVVLCLQTVWVVSQPQQATGEMPEELQVHWHRVSVCGVWGKGETHTHTGRVVIIGGTGADHLPTCLGVADQGGCSHAKPRREPDGCC